MTQRLALKNRETIILFRKSKGTWKAYNKGVKPVSYRGLKLAFIMPVDGQK